MRLKKSKKFNILMKLYRAGIRPYNVGILKNKNGRAMLSKLRINAHKLAIEGVVEEPGFKNVKNKHLGMSPF